MSIRADPSDIEVVVPSAQLGLGAAIRTLHRYLADSLPRCRLVEAGPSGESELAGAGRVFLFPTGAWG